jgi:autotransporter-associated beta strand protein
MADRKNCAGATDFTLAALAGSGGVIDSSGTATLYLDPSGGTLNCFGAIADGAGLVSLALTASGTLVLYGTNSYTGGTTVTAGTLEVGSSGLLPIGACRRADDRRQRRFDFRQHVFIRRLCLCGHSRRGARDGRAQARHAPAFLCRHLQCGALSPLFPAVAAPPLR